MLDWKTLVPFLSPTFLPWLCETIHSLKLYSHTIWPLSPFLSFFFPSQVYEAKWSAVAHSSGQRTHYIKSLSIRTIPSYLCQTKTVVRETVILLFCQLLLNVPTGAAETSVFGRVLSQEKNGNGWHHKREREETNPAGQLGWWDNTKHFFQNNLHLEIHLRYQRVCWQCLCRLSLKVNGKTVSVLILYSNLSWKTRKNWKRAGLQGGHVWWCKRD